MCFLPLQQDFYSKSRPAFQSDQRLCTRGNGGRRGWRYLQNKGVFRGIREP